MATNRYGRIGTVWVHTHRPVRDLVACVSENERKGGPPALKVLREPLVIEDWNPGSEDCRELLALKVFAKRARRMGAEELKSASTKLLKSPQSLTDLDLIAPPVALRRGRPEIWAEAWTAQSTLLARCHNLTHLRRDAHAEHLLFEKGQQEGWLPHCKTVRVSLKPCRFCAALLYEWSVTYGIYIEYLENDPGPWGKSTLLDSDSNDRRRFFPKDREQRESHVSSDSERPSGGLGY